MRLTLVKSSLGGSSKGSKIVEEENVALASKGKEKKGPSQGQRLHGGEKKKDMSKIKCFKCGEFGTTVLSVLRGRRTRRRSRQQLRQRFICWLEEDFALYAAMPPEERWGDIEL